MCHGKESEENRYFTLLIYVYVYTKYLIKINSYITFKVNTKLIHQCIYVRKGEKMKLEF